MRRFLVAGALILTSLFVAVLVFEVLLRAIGFSAPVWSRPDPQLGWTLRPGLAAWFTQEGRAFVRVNRWGQRDREHPIEKPANLYRIAVLGDSYAEARQVAAEETFWALLPERLERCGFQPGKRIEVLNFGVGGYGTAQEYLVLESTAMRYRPDLVLLQFTNGNDVMDNSVALALKKNRPFFVLEHDGGLRIDRSFASAPEFRSHASRWSEALRRASDHSRVLQLVRASRERSFIRSAQAQGAGIEQGLEPFVLAPPSDAQWEEAWRVTEALIARNAEHAARNSARFMVMTVPYAIQVHPDPKARAAVQAKLGVPDLLYPDRRIAEFAKRRGIHALPLAPEMQRLAEASGAYFHGFPNVGIGRGHWNAAGHRTAADLIAQRLCAAPAADAVRPASAH